ncbi:hypothetical protein M758_3G201100 [Ceratodon purpureus]|nr:hypothetical protein M758_3G201100 [Ceratodon purpureus]
MDVHMSLIRSTNFQITVSLLCLVVFLKCCPSSGTSPKVMWLIVRPHFKRLLDGVHCITVALRAAIL